MTKEELINNMSFRQKCGRYGLDWKEDIIGISKDAILLNKAGNVVVLFDKNYNTISVESNVELSSIEEIDYYMARKYREYSSFTDDMPFGENFGYPFEKYTLKDVVDISNRIETMEVNHGHSIIFKVNGEWYENDPENDYLQILAYIKFLGEELKQYFLYCYNMQMMEFEVPDPYLYIRRLIKKVDESVEYYTSRRMRPYPCDVLNYIGQNHRELNYDGILYCTIDLLMRQKGIKIKSGFPNELEIIKNNTSNNLSDVANKALEILKVSDEEVKQREIAPIEIKRIKRKKL